MSAKKYLNRTTAYYSAILMLSLSVISCTKSLDRFPETQIGVSSFFNTEADLNLYTNNMYDFSGTGIYTDEAYTLTDNAWSTGSVELKNMMRSSPSSSTITTGWNWDQLRKVNIFLANFKKAKITQERLDHFEGLARFFRARFYADKIKRYSDVPWIDAPVETASEEILFATRDSRETVVTHILEDYDFAVSHIDEDASAGAVTRWVAKADYARFLLYEGTFRKYHAELNLQGSATALLQKAVEMANDIMGSGKFNLYTTGKPDRDYGSLFDNENLDANPEIILARRYENNVLNGDVGEGVFGNYETSPTKDLVQAYLMMDGSFYSSQPNYQQNEYVQEFKNRDPRLWQTYAYPGWVLDRSGTYAQGAGLYVQQLQKNFSGYHQIKGFYNYTIQADRNGKDIPLYRFAEILLIYAEAKAELEKITQTDLDNTINRLRDRVGMPHLMLSAPVDPVESAKFPNVTGGLRGLVYEIRRERIVELSFEGQRYDDLMRWGAGKLLEKEPQGIYFSSLGKKDMTGDGIEDIYLLPASQSIPADKETNSLGQVLRYYRVGTFGEDVNLFLGNITSGNMQTIEDMGTFVTPKYYYRPIPQAQIALNSNLKQIFGWE
ncbi:MAG TPA: RagB/SusD family nutrient uptake outer membrane protein [Flavitalea sp.]|nr:RagB/SusD family nutrient uptake outer membrane protein [Flavitalea sp.]